MKRTLSLILVILSLFSVFAISVSANDIGIQPLWDNTSMVFNTITISEDGYGYAEGTVRGHNTVNKIQIDVYVYMQSGTTWSYVDEEHVSVDYYATGISCQFIPTEGAYYKADFTYTVTKNGVDEIINKTSYYQN